ncbi:hypothetical protein AUJ14_05280 [Candidatus Micrarchaeota archaeon CG1_02_55_22]|nr:MAG: hypothetical protein AUJ14_05280 [Candidatus Micrarchaeota archaeon CG1_02_55_22]
MAWEVSWSEEAAGFVSKLERSAAKRIVEKVEFASRDPSKYFSRLVGYDDYKLRVGDYRVIALLIHSEKKLFIEKVGHRKNVYK